MDTTPCTCGGAKCRLSSDDTRHGTHNGYTNYRCRCAGCRSAYTEFTRSLKELGLPSGDSRHGTPAGYSRYGCRCADCQSAHKERATRYREQNVESHRTAKSKRDREYRESPYGRRSHLAAYQRRRARQRGQLCGMNCVSANAIAELLEAVSGRCVYCGGTGSQLDHIVSLAEGGLHCLDNLTIACQRCNCRKNRRSLDEFVSRMDRLGVTLLSTASTPFTLGCVTKR